ncbi:hypothetical protein DERP_014133 [Dermatophagoides pteronyssinus]|uniref:Uncharacterized protein n=1 Tax=Dermatophagoides pteronyssinus TaxID=6956 RepID=A0ABQ8IXH6_DERPT|nr:hypothetical protein DERP_014133 [Dermatophagoides pteronyssinus]
MKRKQQQQKKSNYKIKVPSLFPKDNEIVYLFCYSIRTLKSECCSADSNKADMDIPPKLHMLFVTDEIRVPYNSYILI